MSSKNRNRNQTGNESLPVTEEEVETQSDELTEDVVVETATPVIQEEVLKEPEPVKTVTLQPTVKAVNNMDDLELFLAKYLEGVTTLKHENDFAKLQLSFFRKVLGVLNRTSFEEARLGLNAILKFFHQNKDRGLNEINLFRGAAHWEESPHDFSTFRRLVWIFLQTADPSTRKANSNNVDLTMLEKQLNNTQYTNLISFFS